MTKAAGAPDRDWLKLWYALQETPWTTLAVVPTDPGIDPLKIATKLVSIGQLNGSQHISLLNAVGARFNDVQTMLGTIEGAKTSGRHLVVACDSVEGNPAALPLARAATGVFLLVKLGDSLLESARKTVEAVGRERVMASITLD